MVQKKVKKLRHARFYFHHVVLDFFQISSIAENYDNLYWLRENITYMYSVFPLTLTALGLKGKFSSGTEL